MPRKTCGQLGVSRQQRLASMRPRPDAAENTQQTNRSKLDEHASMRPRPDAAENSIMARLRGGTV